MIEQLINILRLPERVLVKKKITKAFFKRNFDMTISEKGMLEDFAIVNSIDWIGSISPTNSNIPAIIVENSTFEEIQIIGIQTSEETFDKFKYKLVDFIQKYIPYHSLVIVNDGTNFIMNVSLKQINLNDANKRIISAKFETESIRLDKLDSKQEKFLKSLQFSNISKHNLQSFFNGYMQSIVALSTSQINGDFHQKDHAKTIEDVELMNKIAQLKKEIEKLQKIAQKETQMSNRVKLNQEIQLKRNDINTFEQIIRK